MNMPSRRTRPGLGARALPLALYGFATGKPSRSEGLLEGIFMRALFRTLFSNKKKAHKRLSQVG